VVASAANVSSNRRAAGVAGRLGLVACGRLEDLLGKPGLLAERGHRSRVPCLMNTRTYRRFSVTVSTVKKSHAMIPRA
jgi:hypothetical protein